MLPKYLVDGKLKIDQEGPQDLKGYEGSNLKEFTWPYFLGA